jgi:uncharacterized protein (TIGR00661 family)
VKILYGVQGTGNGHLSRARAMARHLKNRHVDVTYLFSGRPRESYFEMEAFGDFMVREGLTFAVEKGQVSYPKTLLKNNPLTFVNEVRTLDLSTYDLVLCDFDPVTAWAAKLRGKPVIGFGHQSAFKHKIPIEGNDPIAHLVMRLFAPSSISIGLHWHHFDQPILPPIIHVDELDKGLVQENKVLVYLPFEEMKSLSPLFKPFGDYEFYFFHPEFHAPLDQDHLHFRPLSVQQFQADLHSCAAVICSAGFELPSECIHLGKKLLVKPVKNQMEQASNGLALEQLGLGKNTQELTPEVIGEWLNSDRKSNGLRYPDVAKALVDWILSEKWDNTEKMREDLWGATTV